MKRSQNISEYKGKEYAFNVSESSNAQTGGSIYNGDSYTAIWPVAYLDLNNEMHPFTSAEAENPEFSYLIRKSGNAYTFAADGFLRQYQHNQRDWRPCVSFSQRYQFHQFTAVCKISCNRCERALYPGFLLWTYLPY